MLRPKPFSHAAFDYQPEQLGKRTVAFEKAWPRVFLANGASTHAQLERLRQRLADYLLGCASQGEVDSDLLAEQAVGALVKCKRAARAYTGATSRFKVDVRGNDIVVSLPHFTAVYYKPAGQPQLILRQRSKCDDYELLAEVYQAAVAKARELGWLA